MKNQNFLGQIRLANFGFWGILLSILLFTIVTEGFDHFLLIYLQKIGGNIYVNGIVCGVIQVLAYSLTYFMANYRRMVIFRIVSLMVILASIFFILAKIYGLDQKAYYDHLAIGVIAVEYFFTSVGQSIVFVYPVEVFPTTTRMLAIGFLGLFMYFLIPSLIWISSFLE